MRFISFGIALNEKQYFEYPESIDEEDENKESDESSSSEDDCKCLYSFVTHIFISFVLHSSIYVNLSNS